MEWVETTARTVEEAVDLALDQLGVDEQEAEWEVLEEPRPGLFGRVRGTARIRARITPKAQPSKGDRRDRRRGGKGKESSDRSRPAREAAPDAAPDEPGTSVVTEEREEPPAERPRRRRERGAGGGDRAARSREQDVTEQTMDATAEEVAEQIEAFLTGLVDAFGEPAPVVIDQRDDEVVGRVDAKIGLMIGPKGQTLDAIQELTRITAQRTAPSEIRIKVDVGDYRLHRQQALERFARQVADKVRETGKAVALEPMPSSDRKIVHDALAEEPGVSTHSDGAEPRRRVVVAPAEGD